MGDRKTCSKCGEYKFLPEYDKACNRKMGVKSACKPCNKPMKQRYYENNKEKYKQHYQEFIGRNPEYQNIYRMKKKDN